MLRKIKFTFNENNKYYFHIIIFKVFTVAIESIYRVLIKKVLYKIFMIKCFMYSYTKVKS